VHEKLSPRSKNKIEERCVGNVCTHTWRVATRRFGQNSMKALYCRQSVNSRVMINLNRLYRGGFQVYYSTSHPAAVRCMSAAVPSTSVPSFDSALAHLHIKHTSRTAWRQHTTFAVLRNTTGPRASYANPRPLSDFPTSTEFQNHQPLSAKALPGGDHIIVALVIAITL